MSLTIEYSAPVDPSLGQQAAAAEAAATEGYKDEENDATHKDTSNYCRVVLDVIPNVTTIRNILSTVAAESFVIIIEHGGAGQFKTHGQLAFHCICFVRKLHKQHPKEHKSWFHHYERLKGRVRKGDRCEIVIEI